MANSGGGLIIVGRIKSNLRAGTLDDEQIRSFDPTDVNKLVHQYLAPALECLVTQEDVGTDKLIIIDVPGFSDTPLIFTKVGNCGSKDCRQSPHFRNADIFVRSKAMESRRVEDPDEMRTIIRNAARSLRDDSFSQLRTELGTMIREMRDFIDLQHSVSFLPSVADTVPVENPYDAAVAEDREFFSGFFYPWLNQHGHFDLRIRRVDHKADLIELEQVPNRIRNYAAAFNRNGVVISAPFETTNQIEHFKDGARLKGRHPEWRRVEAAALHSNGAYRIVRAFLEDYKPNADRSSATMDDSDRTLWVDIFVETVTLYYSLAARVASQQGAFDESYYVEFIVDGLAHRRLVANDPELDLTFSRRFAKMTCSEDRVSFEHNISSADLQANSRELAAAACEKVLWLFGVTDKIVRPLQDKFVPKR